MVMYRGIAVGKGLECMMMMVVVMRVRLAPRLGLGDDLRVYGLIKIRGIGEGAERSFGIVMHLLSCWVMEHMVMRLYVASGIGFKRRVQQRRDITRVRICT